jgi:acyl transferase domain-containing protein/acyl carrier protein
VTAGTGWSRPIAIVGMACRVPGARTLDAFWRNLCAGVESVHFFSDAEARDAGVLDTVLRDPHYINAAPILEDYDCFDATFFRYSPREAAWLDPQHRQFIECAWEALEGAGCDPFQFPGAIGLFAGAGGSVSSYLFALADRFRDYVGSTASGPHLANDKDFLTTRVSYKLNLRGPSVNIQTACSTSLVAVHLACRSLLDGDCDMALAGGVSVRVPHLVGYFARDGNILSPDGHCRPFDARACGTLFGSGVGVVVLKPLDRAVADGDHIYALVLGSALNNDGGDKLSYTAASVDGQERCIRAAFVAAQVEPATIGYVEAHGTATALGDPIEIDALNRVFGKAGRCSIGSVKGNVGHLEAAAGVIGLIKAALALKHARLPPSINCTVPNPRINFEAGPFFVQQQSNDWLGSGSPRRAAVNSLGIGGTNAHVILEEPPGLPRAIGLDRGVHLLCLSAQSEEALAELARRYADALAGQPTWRWADICHTANTGRARLDRRLAVLAKDATEAAQHLRRFIAGHTHEHLWAGSADDGAHSTQDFSAGERPATGDIGAWSKLLAEAARGFVRGSDVLWASLEAGLPLRRKLPLPTYPFRRDRHWIGGSRTAGITAPATLLGSSRSSPLSGETSFESPLDVGLFPVLAEHRIFECVVVPGAAYLAMALTGGATSSPQAFADIEFTRPLVLPDGRAFTLQLLLSRSEPDGRQFNIFARSDGDQWVKHASGRLLTDGTGSFDATLDRRTFTAGVHEFTGAELYDGLRKLGLDLGPAFQVVRRWWHDGDILAALAVPPTLENEWDRYFIHPAMLDGCFQLIVGDVAMAGDGTQALFLPLDIERMVWHRRPGREFFCRIKLHPGRAVNNQTVNADLTLFDGVGVLAEIVGFTGKRADRAALLRAAHSHLDDWLHAIAWRACERTPARSGSSGASQRWLIVPDASGVAAELAKRLLALGHLAVLVRGTDSPDRLPGGEFDAVVQLQALDAYGGSPAAHQERLLGGTLAIVQRLLHQSGAKPPRLWLVSRGAQVMESDALDVALAQASLWGFAQALKQEHPELACSCLDLDPRRPPDEIDELLAELLAGDAEDRVALRDQRRFVARLVRLARLDTDRRLPLPDGLLRLSIDRRGTIDDLHLEAFEPKPPGPGQVQIQVTDAGLNFRDVLNVLGLYPGDPGALGMECAGIVCAIGPGVDRFGVGDAVIALAQGSLASLVNTPADLVMGKPCNLTFAEAAAIPVVFATGELALARLGKLRRGERVLIHGSAGGVGWAALQIARRIGAEIYATANRGKWNYLRSLGIEHVFDSRTVEFGAAILGQTKGRGVDVVLNSLGGDFIPASLDVLAPGGRFIEIGKQGIWDRERVALRRPDVAYHVLALDRLMGEAPVKIGAVLRDVVRDIAGGALQPPPVAVMPIAHTRKALRRMQQGRHIGKIVIQLPTPGGAVRSDATYLVTGGSGGLGLEVARWLVGRGAQNVLLLGRTAPSQSARTAIARLEQDGVQIKFLAADVSEEHALRQAWTDAEAVLPPIRGVIHAAGIVDDGLIEQQSWSRIRSVLAPKLVGAWNLHQLTRHKQLDFFILFSSSSSVLGALGQTSYAAGNAFLDALACQRRRLGLPAVSVTWGPWAESGMAARLDPGLRKAWMERGFHFLPPKTGCDLLERILELDPVCVTALRIDWQRYRAAVPGGETTPFLAELVSAPPTPATVTSLAQQLAAANFVERRRLLTDYLKYRVMHVLGVGNGCALDELTPLPELGLDSLMALELLVGLQAEVKGVLMLPPTLILDYPSIRGLVDYLAARLDSGK